MRRLLALLPPLLVAAAPGCGDPAPICTPGSTGSATVVLASFADTSGGIQPYLATQLELGLDYFYVMGDCTYYVARPHPPRPEAGNLQGYDYDVRTGQVSSDDARELGKLAEDASSTGCSGTPPQDASPLIIWQASGPRSCGTADEMFDGVSAVAQRSFDKGVALKHAVRLIVTPENSVPTSWPALPWPLGDIAPFTKTRDDVSRAGISVKVTGDDADKLRALRDAYLAGPTSLAIPVSLPSDVDTTVFHRFVVMREALPIEDERGLIRLSGLQYKGDP